MVLNTHTRDIPVDPVEIGKLLDGLASEDDHLWPCDAWPAMRFDRPLSVGATGGHGPIRYFVEAYEPGKSISFRFTAPAGFEGTHGFVIQQISPGMTRLRHVLSMRATGSARWSWPLAYRWLHDALLEDALDCAEAYTTAQPVRRRSWSFWVRFLRGLITSRQRRVKQRNARLEIA